MEKLFSKYGEKILLAAGLSLLIFFSIDLIAGHSETHIGEVVEKFYKPESEYWTLETKHNGDHTTTELVHHHDPAIWKLFLKKSDGEIIGVPCKASRYYQTAIGERIPYKIRYGRYTKIAWVYSTL